MALSMVDLLDYTTDIVACGQKKETWTPCRTDSPLRGLKVVASSCPHAYLYWDWEPPFSCLGGSKEQDSQS